MPSVRRAPSYAPLTLRETKARAAALARWRRRYDFVDCPLVYLLWMQRRCVYVGATTQLHERLAAHLRTRPPRSSAAGRAYTGAPGAWFDYEEYVLTPSHLLYRREAALVAYLRPLYNAPRPLTPVLCEHLRSMGVETPCPTLART